jgi:hypothetical protein
MNPDTIQDLAGTIFVTIAWIGCLTFVIQYAAQFDWRAGLPGRTMMRAKMSLLLVLTWIVVARWIPIDEETRDWISLGIFAPLAVVQVMLSYVLFLTGRGKISRTTPNYTPFRDWWKRRIAKRNGKV